MSRQTNLETPSASKNHRIAGRITQGAVFESSTFRAGKTRGAKVFIRILLSLLGLFCMASANAVFGQSYVSSSGNDANPCDAANPCRTVNRALAAAGVGGTALLADAGPYDAFVITRSARVVAVTGAAPRRVAPGNRAAPRH